MSSDPAAVNVMIAAAPRSQRSRRWARDPRAVKGVTDCRNRKRVNGSEPDTPNAYTNSTTYTYDFLNQLTNVSMQTASGTQTRSFTYNGLDRISETNPENGTVT